MIYFSPLGFITLKFLEPNAHEDDENDGDDNNKSHIIVNDTIKINNINKTYKKIISDDDGWLVILECSEQNYL